MGGGRGRETLGSAAGKNWRERDRDGGYVVRLVGC